MLDFSKNFFELFGLPETYPVNEELLSDRYHALQQAVHPDRFAAAGETEKRLSMQASTHVNEAYETLRDQLRSARYLLSLRTAKTGGENPNIQDTGFLLEQMELREALAVARSGSDPYAALQAVMDRLDLQCARLVAQLAERLNSLDSPGFDEADELLKKFQFVRKCQAEAEQLEGELDDRL